MEKITRQVQNESTMAAITKHLETVYERMFATAKDRQQRKFKHIQAKSTKLDETDNDTIDKDRWVVNISSYGMNETEKKILSRGLNFAVTPPKLPVDEYIVATEMACQQLNDSSKAAALRSDVTRILSKRRNTKQNISLEERKALENLSRNKDLQILPADKGRVTVLMNSCDYHAKIKELLTDHNTYVKLKSDPTNKFKAKVVQLLKSWKDKGKITQKTWQQLYPTAAETPKFYGLPKVHKKKLSTETNCLKCRQHYLTICKNASQNPGPIGRKNPTSCEE